MRPGIYRRRIQICTEPGRAYALLEDDPHCYQVTVSHDGHHVESVVGDAIRTPWETCAAARHNLTRLVGMPLDHNALRARDFTDPGQQCTHMFDAAALAIAHAARGIESRRYDINVECWSFEGKRSVQMSIDGKLTFDGVIDNEIFVDPEHLRGISTRSVYQWATQNLTDADALEAIWVLRRAIYISNNRQADLDAYQYAIEVSPGYGACYVYQPGVAEAAARVQGSTKDFTEHTEQMLGWERVKGP